MPTSDRTRHTPSSLDTAGLREAAVAGALASALSAGVLMLRGRRDAGSALAPVNAPSHWLFGKRALRADGPSWRHTFCGLLIHHGSSVMWAWLFSRSLRQAHRSGHAVSPAWGAVCIAALAAWVDFRLVPPRLTPGFEPRLSRSSLVLVYAAFGLGLAWGSRLCRPTACPEMGRPGAARPLLHALHPFSTRTSS